MEVGVVEQRPPADRDSPGRGWRRSGSGSRNGRARAAPAGRPAGRTPPATPITLLMGLMHLAVDDRPGQHLGIGAVETEGREQAIADHHEDSLRRTGRSRGNGNPDRPTRRPVRGARTGTGTGWARRRPATRCEVPRRAGFGASGAGPVASPSSTRQRLSLTGRPRLSSASSTSPPASTETANSRVPSSAPGRRCAPR